MEMCIILDIVCLISDGYIANCIYNDINCIVKYIKTDKKCGISNKILREINVLKNVKHPNIVTLYGVEFDETGAYLFLEDCGERIIDFDFDSVNKEKMMGQLVSAVNFLHRMGYYHGDISLTNVMIKIENGEQICKLIDFGSSSQINWNVYPNFPTIYITPPEMIETFVNQIDAKKIDLWAIGVICYYVITGDILFVADTIDLHKKQICEKLGVKNNDYIFDPVKKINLTMAFCPKYKRLKKFKNLLNVLPSKRTPLDELLPNIIDCDPNKIIVKKRNICENYTDHTSFNVQKAHMLEMFLSLNNNNNIAPYNIFIVFSIINYCLIETTQEYEICCIIMYYLITKLVFGSHIDLQTLQYIIECVTKKMLSISELINNINKYVQMINWKQIATFSFESFVLPIHFAIYMILMFNAEFNIAEMYDKLEILDNVSRHMKEKTRGLKYYKYVEFINNNIQNKTNVYTMVNTYLKMHNHDELRIHQK